MKRMGAHLISLILLGTALQAAHAQQQPAPQTSSPPYPQVPLPSKNVKPDTGTLTPTRFPYEIQTLFEIVAGTQSPYGIRSFALPRKLTSNDTVHCDVMWGEDGYVYVIANYGIFQGMEPSATSIKKWMPAQVQVRSKEEDVFKVDRQGKLIQSWMNSDRSVVPIASRVSPQLAIDPTTLNWFKENLGALPEYASHRYKMKWRDENQIKERWINPFFDDGHFLGKYRGKSYYLMDIVAHSASGRVHGVADSFGRIYVMAEKSVVFSAESVGKIGLDESSGILYEFGMISKGRWLVRIWTPQSNDR